MKPQLSRCVRLATPLRILVSISTTWLLIPAASSAADNASAVFAASSANVEVAQPWRDATKDANTRADLLLARMTKTEKVTLVTATQPNDTASLDYLGIPHLTRVDASCGLRGDTGVTAFPVPIALASSFDLQLAADMGADIGAEARQKAWNVILGPTVDIARDPLSGRITESFGEDPLVNGLMGATVAHAMQSQHTITQVKHYTVYNQESDRGTVDVKVSERALKELYDPAFQMVINLGGADSIMGSYPRVNGTYACENPLLVANLKNNPNFKGYVGTDAYAGHDLVAQMNAGIDSMALQSPDFPKQAFTDGRISNARLDDSVKRILYAAFKDGLFDDPLPIKKADIVTTPEHQALAKKIADEGIVLLKNEQGILPLPKKGRIVIIGPAGLDTVTSVQGSTHVDPGHFTTPVDAIKQAVGESGTVTVAQGTLGDVDLPIIPSDAFTKDGKSGLEMECFAGPDCHGPSLSTITTSLVDFKGKPVKTLPDVWSARWTGMLTPSVSGLTRFSVLVSGSVTVTIDGHPVITAHRSEASFMLGDEGGHSTFPAQGTAVLTAGHPVKIEVKYAHTDATRASQELHLGWQPQSLITAAASAAKDADVAIVVVNQHTGEEMDRLNLSLPGDQDQLIDAVSAANPNTIVVLNTPGAVLMPWLKQVKGVVQLWYPGAAAGTSLADVLFGDVDPGGRLPITFPASDKQGPELYQGGGVVHYDEGVFVGYRYFSHSGEVPLFPFGYGLSYTSFTYSQLVTSNLSSGSNPQDETLVKLRVKNTGTRSGADVVQVYLGSLPTHEVETPSKKLAGFQRVELQPQEEREVDIAIPRKAFAFWSEKKHAWTTPSGSVPVYVAQSATDVKLTGNITVGQKNDDSKAELTHVDN